VVHHRVVHHRVVHHRVVHHRVVHHRVVHHRVVQAVFQALIELNQTQCLIDLVKWEVDMLELEISHDQLR